MSAQVWALVPAAGRGARMGAALPKQYLSIEGRTVIEHTLSRLLAYAPLRKVMVALAADDELFAGLPVAADARVATCIGGAERSDSVLYALDALAAVAADDDLVLVHDAARPCVRLSDLARLVGAAAADASGAILAMPVNDTVKQADGQRTDTDARIAATLDRRQIWCAATPQAFRFAALRSALRAAHDRGVAVTDEAQAMELAGFSPRLVACARDNLKITRPEDLALAGFWLRRQREEANA